MVQQRKDTSVHADLALLYVAQYLCYLLNKGAATQDSKRINDPIRHECERIV